MPHKNWLKEDITSDFNIDYPKKGEIIKKAEKKGLRILKLGKWGPGYCQTWIYILIIIGSGFLILAYLPV